MKQRCSVLVIGVALCLTLLAACGKQEEAKVEKAAAKAVAEVKADVKELEAREAGIDAYMYAYPLVTMEITGGSRPTWRSPKVRTPQWASSHGCGTIPRWMTTPSPPPTRIRYTR